MQCVLLLICLITEHCHISNYSVNTTDDLVFALFQVIRSEFVQKEKEEVTRFTYFSTVFRVWYLFIQLNKALY